MKGDESMDEETMQQMKEVADKEVADEGMEDGKSLPEAPVSITVRGYYKGFSVLITKRHAGEEIKLDGIMVAIDNMVGKGFKPSWAEETNGKHEPIATYTCEECGAPAELRSGTSKKTNKPWKAIFCSKVKEHVKWI